MKTTTTILRERITLSWLLLSLIGCRHTPPETSLVTGGPQADSVPLSSLILMEDCLYPLMAERESIGSKLDFGMPMLGLPDSVESLQSPDGTFFFYPDHLGCNLEAFPFPVATDGEWVKPGDIPIYNPIKQHHADSSVVLWTGAGTLPPDARSVIVVDAPAESLGKLRELRSLERIRLIRTTIDWSALAEATQLRELIIEGGSSTGDFSALGELTSLETLSISGHDVERLDLTSLRGNTRIKTMTIASNDNLTEMILPPLESFSELESVAIAHNPGLKSINAVAFERSHVQVLNLTFNDLGGFDYSSLATMPRLKELGMDASELRDDGLVHVAAVPNLASLVIEGYGKEYAFDNEGNRINPQPLDLTPLAAARQLEVFSLYLNDTPSLDLTPLASLPRLRTLQLRSTGLVKTMVIPQIAGLLELDINENFHLQTLDLSRLSGSSRLERIRVAGNFNLEELDLASMSPSSNLKSIAVLGNGGLRTLRLPAAHSLTDVQVIENRSLEPFDLGPLSAANGLLSLSILANGVVSDVPDAVELDLSPLRNARQLEALSLGFIPYLEALDLSPLAGAHGLKQLSLQNLPALASLDLSPLVGAKHLEEFSLSSLRNLGQLDLSPLKQTQLTSLTLSDTGVAALDLQPLSDVTRLRTLTIDQHPNLSELSLPSLSSAQEITKLSLTNLPSLGEIDLMSLEGSTIKRLFVSGNASLTALTIPNLPQLQVLQLNGNGKLTTIGLAAVTDGQLRMLSIAGNTTLTTLELPKSMHSLEVVDNDRLEALKLEGVSGLGQLTVVDNEALRIIDLTDFASLGELKAVSVSKNAALEAIDFPTGEMGRFANLSVTENPALLTLKLDALELAGLRYLHLKENKSLQTLGLPKLPGSGPTEVAVTGNGALESLDLSPFAGSQGLRIFELGYGGSTPLDLTPLADSGLRSLDVSVYGVATLDLTPLADSGLRSLDVSVPYNATTKLVLPTLSSGSALERLSLYTGGATTLDVTPISSGRLTEFKLTAGSGMTELDLRPLSSARDLEGLNIHVGKSIASLLLPSSPSLVKVEIRGEWWSDGVPQHNLVLSELDLSPLAMASQLQRLNIGDLKGLKSIDFSPESNGDLGALKDVSVMWNDSLCVSFEQRLLTQLQRAGFAGYVSFQGGRDGC